MAFATLPNEILLEIGHVCTVQSLSSLRAVNHYLNDLLSDIFYKKFAIPASKDLWLPTGGVVSSDNPAGRAIVNDWTLVLKRLLERGLDANTEVWRGASCLSLLQSAVMRAKKPAVKLLLEFGADIEAPVAYDLSPLMLACMRGDMEMVRLLLEKGANVNRARENWTPLHNAVQYQKRPDNTLMVKLLLEFGADIEALDTYGLSPLMIACNRGDMEMVRLLLEKGANVNGADEDWTPLHNAVQYENRPAVEVLLEFGADIDALASGRMSPLMLACTMWPSHKEIIVILLENGADVEVGNWPG